MAAFDQAYRLLRSVKFSSETVKFRGLGFFLALAVNQKQPNIALEILQQLKFKSHSTIYQSIRLQAFADIGRFYEVRDILQYQLRKDKAIDRSKVIFHDTVRLL